MTAHSPFTARNSQSLSNWSLMGAGKEAEIGRLERYCSEMNARDPHKRLWFVAQAENGNSYVDCRPRKHGEW